MGIELKDSKMEIMKGYSLSHDQVALDIHGKVKMERGLNIRCMI